MTQAKWIASTESDWLEATHPMPMLEYLEGRASHRKLMLFSVACLRRIWHLLTDERGLRLVETTERFADSLVSPEELYDIHNAFYQAYTADGIQDGAGGNTHEAVDYVARKGAGAAIQVASQAAESAGYAAAISVPVATPDDWSPARTAVWTSAEQAEWAAQVALIRDIFGNPFCPASINPSWLTPKVLSFAQTTYEQRAFDQLPILAEALEEAGCRDADLLPHCCVPGLHVRGCWVLDLILGKH